MKKETYLILDNIRSRENVGSIFRTADGAGVSKIYLCGTTPIPPHHKISKTALGAEMYVPWEYCKQTWRCLLKLKSKKEACEKFSLLIQRKFWPSIEKLKIIGLERFDKLTASKPKIRTHNLFTFEPKFPIALIVGNEVRGLSPRILKYCDKIVHIPMLGKKESLNVSVAAGVALYQLISK